MNAVFGRWVIQKSLQIIWCINALGSFLKISVSDGFPQVVDFFLENLGVIFRVIYFEFILFVKLFSFLDFLNDKMFFLDHESKLLLIPIHLIGIYIRLGNGRDFIENFLMFSRIKLGAFID